jgi:8-oxo-dGTP pyrophosphatase MutT (NUDIX family)
MLFVNLLFVLLFATSIILNHTVLSTLLGETLQDCVRREIAEEAGVVVERIEYFQSQTWPLPQSSLMLGCTAIAMPDSETVGIPYTLTIYCAKTENFDNLLHYADSWTSMLRN